MDEDQKLKIHQFLAEKGFRCFGRDRFKDADLWQKSVEGTDRHSIHVWEYDFMIRDEHRFYSFEIEMTFETKGEHWAQIKYYSISAEDLEAKIDEFTKNLHSCVVKLNGNEKHYRYNGEN